MRFEKLTRIVSVNFFGEGRQRPQIDAVAHLQHVKIVVADVHAQQIGDTGPVAGRRAHPHDVVVAPLKIHIVIVHEKVQDLIRMRASIKDIADDMQLIDR